MELYFTYILVFLAVSLPMAMWRRDGDDASQMAQERGWKNVPEVFKFLWKPMYILEPSVGLFLSRLLPGMTAIYRKEIEASSLPLTPARIYVCQLLLTPVFTAVGCLSFLYSVIPTGYAVAFVLFMGWVGWYFPWMKLQNYVEHRRTEISKTLPFAIDLIGSAMRAGLEFGAAMRYFTGVGTGGALEEEFSRVLQEVSLGKPIAEGLSDMAARLRIKSFSAFVGTIAYGMEIGASIAETLKIHGSELRRERFSLAEQKAARAPSLMLFPLAVFILPAVFIVIFVPVLLQYKATQGM